MTTYYNIKTSYGVETIDEINSEEFKTFKDFRNERKRMLKEYRLCGSFYSGLYYSSKCTNEWKNQ